jgi:hypothetical protein
MGPENDLRAQRAQGSRRQRKKGRLKNRKNLDAARSLSPKAQILARFIALLGRIGYR